MQLDIKVAVVTGAASGIGEAIALALGREGAAVVIVARKALILLIPDPLRLGGI